MVSETEEKELALCELCGDVITSVSHLKWITEKLGPLAFSNPGLFLAKLKSMKLADDIFVSARDYLLRQDRIKIICAKCRRKAAIERF
jgi:hypothetical protein